MTNYQQPTAQEAEAIRAIEAAFETERPETLVASYEGKYLQSYLNEFLAEYSDFGATAAPRFLRMVEEQLKRAVFVADDDTRSTAELTGLAAALRTVRKLVRALL